MSSPFFTNVSGKYSKYSSGYTSFTFTSLIEALLYSFSLILNFILYVTISPILYSFLGFIISFVKSTFCLCFTNSIFVISDSFPAPSILYICRYLPKEFNLIFSNSPTEFTSCHALFDNLSGLSSLSDVK